MPSAIRMPRRASRPTRSRAMAGRSTSTLTSTPGRRSQRKEISGGTMDHRVPTSTGVMPPTTCSGMSTISHPWPRKPARSIKNSAPPARSSRWWTSSTTEPRPCPTRRMFPILPAWPPRRCRIPWSTRAAAPLTDAHRKSAAHLMVDGGFNINSTSVPAWTILLASAHLKRPVIMDSAGTGTPAAQPKGNFIVSRFAMPIGGSAGQSHHRRHALARLPRTHRGRNPATGGSHCPPGQAARPVPLARRVHQPAFGRQQR